MINQDLFYRRHGVRIPQQLMTPIISTLNRFEFPRNSLYNHLTFDGVINGPASDEYILRLVTKLILVDHVVDLSSNKGFPRKINKAILPYIREYHAKNRRFRYVKDLVSIHRDENTLLVLNFDLVTKMYRYIRSMYSEYYKWSNIQSTLWTQANITASVSTRNQYFFATLPKTLPSVTSLNAYCRIFNSSLTKIFPSHESLFILEMWKWFSQDYRDQSVLAGLSKENLNKINIVYQESGSWIMFNLGVLESWRFVIDESDEHQKTKIPPDQLQKRFLRMLMTLMSVRSSPIEEENEAEEPLVEEGKQSQNDIAHDHELDEETRLEKADRILESMDGDLSELEHIESKVIVDDTVNAVKINSGKIVINDFHTEVSTEGVIVGICDKLAEDGLLTAAVYRNLVNSSKNYQTIVSPDGKSTLEEFVKISQEDVNLGQSQAIPDIKTVTDKSMLKSSLLKFDQTYINKVLDKDVAGMVVNIQRGGVILSNYTVEKEQDMLGNYENHILRVRPVEGVASTIRFKLPSVDEDGVIKYNGTKYKLRKQRGDVPIRKIGSDTVALTSYYGKTFVSTNARKVNDYGNWLRARIMLKGLDNNDMDITQLSTADVFDNTFDCPKVYSVIAKGFRSFTSGNYHFMFDYTKREEFFGASVVNSIESEGIRIIAKDDKGGYLAIDDNDAIYEVRNGSQILKGKIETILGIDQENVPTEFSEIRIFGKFIPVCFFLAYQLGLTKLIELLKVEPRRVPTGERVGLDVDEYALVFNDTTLVFSKEDKLATMILAGFMQYDKVLKKYPASTMDKQNVYLNILESSSLTARYLREMDLMNNLFVDPITKELLTEMNEPTTVRGLLVRSSALLLKDQHPDQMDMRYMRIKGYERLSGAVYSELVQSIRAHGARAGKSSRPLEMHPYAVWKRVVQDPSMSLISDINPIQNLKETEAVTFSGTGGRSARSLVKGSRKYHYNDMGVISESTVDSGNVGVITYLSADPQFKTLRGTTKQVDISNIDPTSLMSTSALMAPGSSNDDPKRVKSL